MPRRHSNDAGAGSDLFSADVAGDVAHRLDRFRWPDQARFPVNRGSAHVRRPVWSDLVSSTDPMVVAGYSSIAQIVELVAAWGNRHHDGTVRVVLGAEPFPTTRWDFSSATAGFTEEVSRYWLEQRGVSLRLSAKIVTAIAALDAGHFRVRFLHGTSRLHAKVYVGTAAATVGSSNLTDAGLSSQIEANARFEDASEPARYRELVVVAENLWQAGTDWTAEMRELLEALLQVVGWREALARACADLLEGEWADRYLGGGSAADSTLWPSQRAGIAQSLWILKDVGSVLVADATGSGKTRMGAHLVRAARDRLWSTGRVRRDLTVVVCPPAVQPTWDREAVACGLPLRTTSHGLLSRPGDSGSEHEAVARSQILAVDEAHNFLNRTANRTRELRNSRADHVLLFTATPINRGAADLLALVALLGADNFADTTLEALARLERRRTHDAVLAPDEADALRAQIARFTVRRTKAVLNDLVERDTDAYRHPDTGRVCRYPAHDPRTYPTGETEADEMSAVAIRAAAASLTGVAQIERVISVPAGLRREYDDARWLAFRTASVRGLAAHHVFSALRSSRAALLEHLDGTEAAIAHFGLEATAKAVATGDVRGKLEGLAVAGPPQIALGCPIPEWLTDPAAWAEMCRAEAARYTAIQEALLSLSAARENTKAALIASLAGRHDRVLAFDQHPLTLAAMAGHLAESGVEAIVAIGGDTFSRKQVERRFARTATTRAVALCSDALNEGLNLQGASALVHLDLPTTLRVAEQRVGRVDRMDTPHDRIEVWWPDDGPAFATRANEMLLRRSEESAQLLGSNLHVPDLGGRDTDRQVDLAERIAAAETPEAETWDGIRDALEPVRQLVSGSHPLIAPDLYDTHRTTRHRVVARVSPVRSSVPWAFLAIQGSSDGAPRWQYLHGHDLRPVGDLDVICRHLRTHLADDPPSRGLDDDATALLDRALTVAARTEIDMLPRRLRRALEQMDTVLDAWIAACRRAGDELNATALVALRRLAHPDAVDGCADPYSLAERWLTVVADDLNAYRQTHRHKPYILLRDVTPTLEAKKPPLDTLHAAFEDTPVVTPLAERVSACILGVPGPKDPPPPATGPGRSA
jgi:superfamily II DNA or RNA helicase